MRNYAFVEWQLRALVVALALVLSLLAGLLIANNAASEKRVVAVAAPPTLSELAEDYFKTDGIRVDHVTMSVWAIMTQLHHLDDGGSPFLPLLQGAVSPEIYREVEKGFRDALPGVKKDMAVQNLNITSIGDFTVDPQTKRVGCYVRGYFSTIFGQSGKFAIVPYRAELVLEQNVVGNLNPLTYTLIKRTEKIGDRALEWDRERAELAKKKKENARAH